MEVDLNLLTNAKGKRQKRVSQLDDYLDSLQFNYTTGSEDKVYQLENNPWAWWLQYGRQRYPILLSCRRPRWLVFAPK
jgi:hypothetical protein